MSQDAGRGPQPDPRNPGNRPPSRKPTPPPPPTEADTYALSEEIPSWEPPPPPNVYDDNVFHPTIKDDDPRPIAKVPNAKKLDPGARPTGAASRTTRTGKLEPKVVPSKGPTLGERILFGSVSSSQLATFCRQFAAYQEAGVDIVRSLAGLEQQFARTALGPVARRLSDAIKSGETLTEAMSREPQAFDSLILSMMTVAEARGGIPETLKRMANHYEARVRLIRQARSAMIYPVIVVIVCSIVIAILTIFVLPALAAMLLDIAGKVALPLPSRILIGISGFMRANGWWLVPTVAFGSIFGLLNMYRSPRGKAILDEIFLVTPVLKGFVRKIDTSRLSRTLAALLESGVDIGTSLDLTSKVLYLAPYRKAIKEVQVEVMEGMELSAALDATRRFTPDVVAVVESGEETGKLPETLNKLADDYEDQVEYMVKNMGQLIQPLIMVMMGAVVLFIILAVILPYIQVITTLGGG